MELKSCCNDAMMGGLLGSNRTFMELKVHIKSVWEKNEESLLVISYFPHFG